MTKKLENKYDELIDILTQMAEYVSDELGFEGDNIINITNDIMLKTITKEVSMYMYDSYIEVYYKNKKIMHLGYNIMFDDIDYEIEKIMDINELTKIITLKKKAGVYNKHEIKNNS